MGLGPVPQLPARGGVLGDQAGDMVVLDTGGRLRDAGRVGISRDPVVVGGVKGVLVAGQRGFIAGETGDEIYSVSTESKVTRDTRLS